jgi:peptidoglycan/LPS O-acetylase OafA/YrhL
VNLGNTLASLGVLFFFVLSGYLITTLLHREKNRNGFIDLKKFYMRRFLRLFPALAIFLLAVCLLMGVNLLVGIPWYEIAVCVFYVRNIFGRSDSLGHLWSLSLEEQFYSVWPVTVKHISAKRLPAVTLWLVLLISVWRGCAIFFNLFDYNTGVYYLRPYFRFDSILIGCWLAAWLSQAELRNTRRLRSLLRFTPLPVCFALTVGWTLFAEQFAKPVFISVQMALTLLVLCHIILNTDRTASRIFRSNWLRFFGKISYGLYLWQQFFLVSKGPGWGSLREFPLNVAIPILIAVTSYRFLESPFLRWKRRYEPAV